MMRTHYFVLLIVALVIVGCGDGDTPDTTDPGTPYVGGDQGLDMEFVEGAPPPEIYDNGQFPFSIALKLSNIGEANVLPADGYVEIIGINPADFGLSSQLDLKKPIPVELGKARKTAQGTVVLGDIGIVEFNDLNYLPNVHGNFDGPKIRANLCYNYATRTSSKVCVKPDLLSNIDNVDICELSGSKPVSNSGGPLQLTDVSQEPLGSDKIQVRFTIEHVGAAEDRFFKIDTECLDRPTNPDRDVVFVEVLSDVAGAIASCTGFSGTGTGTGGGQPSSSSGFVKLFDGAPRTVVCTFDVSSAPSEFEELFEVGLRYRYYQWIEMPLLVRDVSLND